MAQISSSVLLLALLGLCGAVFGIYQELWLYEADGNGLYFQTQVPDTSKYDLSRITRYCAVGMWYAFSELNFFTFEKGMGSFADGEPECRAVNTTNFRSFRHWAADFTTTDSLSLYSESEYAGMEILVTGKAYAGIPHPIKSIAGTGQADWTLFEGTNLDGRSVCWKVPLEPWLFNFSYIRNLSTVGSVFQGCDLEEIRLYKENQISLHY